MALLAHSTKIRPPSEQSPTVNMHFYRSTHAPEDPTCPSPPPLPPTPPPPPPPPTSSPPPSPIGSPRSSSDPYMGRDPRSEPLKRHHENEIWPNVPCHYQDFRNYRHQEFKNQEAYFGRRPFYRYHRPGLGYRPWRSLSRSESYWTCLEPQLNKGVSKMQKSVKVLPVKESSKPRELREQRHSLDDRNGSRKLDQKETDKDRWHKASQRINPSRDNGKDRLTKDSCRSTNRKRDDQANPFPLLCNVANDTWRWKDNPRTTRLTNDADEDSDHNVRDMEVTSASDDECTEQMLTQEKKSRPSDGTENRNGCNGEEVIDANAPGVLEAVPCKYKCRPITGKRCDNDKDTHNCCDSRQDISISGRSTKVKNYLNKTSTPDGKADGVRLSERANDHRDVDKRPRHASMAAIDSRGTNPAASNGAKKPNSDHHHHHRGITEVSGVHCHKAAMDNGVSTDEGSKNEQISSATRADNVSCETTKLAMNSERDSGLKGTLSRQSSEEFIEILKTMRELHGQEVKPRSASDCSQSALRIVDEEAVEEPKIGVREDKEALSTAKACSLRQKVESGSLIRPVTFSPESVNCSAPKDQTLKNPIILDTAITNTPGESDPVNVILEEEENVKDLEEGEIREDSASEGDLDVSTVTNRSPERPLQDELATEEITAGKKNVQDEPPTAARRIKQPDSLSIAISECGIDGDDSDLLWESDNVFIDDQICDDSGRSEAPERQETSSAVDRASVADGQNSESRSALETQSHYSDISDDEGQSEAKHTKASSISLPGGNNDNFLRKEAGDKEVAFHVEDCELEPSSADILNEFLKFVEKDTTSDAKPQDVDGAKREVVSVDNECEMESDESDMGCDVKRNRKASKRLSEDIEPQNDDQPKRARTKQYQLRSKARMQSTYGLRSNQRYHVQEEVTEHPVVSDDHSDETRFKVCTDSRIAKADSVYHFREEFENPVPLEYRKRRKEWATKQEKSRSREIDVGGNVTAASPESREPVQDAFGSAEKSKSPECARLTDGSIVKMLKTPQATRTANSAEMLESPQVSGGAVTMDTRNAEVIIKHVSFPEAIQETVTNTAVAKPKIPDALQMSSSSTRTQLWFTEGRQMINGTTATMPKITEFIQISASTSAAPTKTSESVIIATNRSNSPRSSISEVIRVTNAPTTTNPPLFEWSQNFPEASNITTGPSLAQPKMTEDRQITRSMAATLSRIPVTTQVTNAPTTTNPPFSESPQNFPGASRITTGPLPSQPKMTEDRQITRSMAATLSRIPVTTQVTNAPTTTNPPFSESPQNFPGASRIATGPLPSQPKMTEDRQITRSMAATLSRIPVTTQVTNAPTTISPPFSESPQNFPEASRIATGPSPVQPKMTEDRQITRSMASTLSRIPETTRATILPTTTQSPFSGGSQMSSGTAATHPIIPEVQPMTRHLSATQPGPHQMADASTTTQLHIKETCQAMIRGAAQMGFALTEQPNMLKAGVNPSCAASSNGKVDTKQADSSASPQPTPSESIAVNKSANQQMSITPARLTPSSAKAGSPPQASNAKAAPEAEVPNCTERVSPVAKRTNVSGGVSPTTTLQKVRPDPDDEIFIVKECPGYARSTNATIPGQSHRMSEYLMMPYLNATGASRAVPIVLAPQTNQQYFIVAPPCNGSMQMGSGPRQLVRQPSSVYPSSVRQSRPMFKTSVPTAPPQLMPIARLPSDKRPNETLSSAVPCAPVVRSAMPGPPQMTNVHCLSNTTTISSATARHYPVTTVFYEPKNGPMPLVPLVKHSPQPTSVSPRMIHSSFYPPPPTVGPQSTVKGRSPGTNPPMPNESAQWPTAEMQKRSQESSTGREAAASAVQRATPKQDQAGGMCEKPLAERRIDPDQHIQAGRQPSSKPLDLTTKAQKVEILLQLLRTSTAASHHQQQQNSTEHITPATGHGATPWNAGQSQVEPRRLRQAQDMARRSQAPPLPPPPPPPLAPACEYAKYFDMTHSTVPRPSVAQPLWHTPPAAGERPEDLRSKESQSSRLRELLRERETAQGQQLRLQQQQEQQQLQQQKVEELGRRYDPSVQTIDLRRNTGQQRLTDPSQFMFQYNGIPQVPNQEQFLRPAYDLSRRSEQQPDSRSVSVNCAQDWQTKTGSATLQEPQWRISKAPERDNAERTFLDPSMFIMPSATDVSRPNCRLNGVVHPTPIKLNGGMNLTENMIYSQAHYHQVLQHQKELQMANARVNCPEFRQVARPMPSLTRIHDGAAGEPKATPQTPHFHDMMPQHRQQAALPQTGLVSGIPHRTFPAEAQSNGGQFGRSSYRGSILALPNKPVAMLASPGKPQCGSAMANATPVQASTEFFKLMTYPSEWCNKAVRTPEGPAIATTSQTNSNKVGLPESMSVRAQIWHPFHSS